jgi:dihydroorotate dehydrogenase (fumarate)
VNLSTHNDSIPVIGSLNGVSAGGWMERWMKEHEYESVQQMQGSLSQRHVAEPAAFERANYMKVLDSYR